MCPLNNICVSGLVDSGGLVHFSKHWFEQVVDLGHSTIESLGNLLMQRYAAIRIVCNLVPSLFLEFNITAGNSNPMSLSEVAKDHTFFIQVEVQIFW